MAKPNYVRNGSDPVATGKGELTSSGTRDTEKRVGYFVCAGRQFASGPRSQYAELRRRDPHSAHPSACRLANREPIFDRGGQSAFQFGLNRVHQNSAS